MAKDSLKIVPECKFLLTVRSFLQTEKTGLIKVTLTSLNLTLKDISSTKMHSAGLVR